MRNERGPSRISFRIPHSAFRIHHLSFPRSMLDKSIKPSSIARYLDDYVVGQEIAKRTLAVAVYSHYRKIEQSRAAAVEIAKSYVMLIGPSGTGKTLMCETLSRFIDVPFVTADATSLAQTRY